MRYTFIKNYIKIQWNIRTVRAALKRKNYNLQKGLDRIIKLKDSHTTIATVDGDVNKKWS